MTYGWLHVFSLLFLSLTVAAVLSINDRDTPRDIVRLTLRRWAKLLGALFLIGVIVHLMSL